MILPGLLTNLTGLWTMGCSEYHLVEYKNIRKIYASDDLSVLYRGICSEKFERLDAVRDSCMFRDEDTNFWDLISKLNKAGSIKLFRSNSYKFLEEVMNFNPLKDDYKGIFVTDGMGLE